MHVTNCVQHIHIPCTCMHACRSFSVCDMYLRCHASIGFFLDTNCRGTGLRPPTQQPQPQITQASTLDWFIFSALSARKVTKPTITTCSLYVYIYIYMVPPPPELSTRLGGEIVCILPLTPSLVQGLLCMCVCVHSVHSEPPCMCSTKAIAQMVEYIVFAQSVSAIELSRVLKFNPED